MASCSSLIGNVQPRTVEGLIAPLRRTALYYGRDRSGYVLVATAARGGGEPAWYRDLLGSAGF